MHDANTAFARSCGASQFAERMPARGSLERREFEAVGLLRFHGAPL
jgi:hypothetical protein